MDPATEVDPLANERRVDAIVRLVDDARDRGSRILAGGDRVGNRGYFYAPTVLTNVPDEASLLHEEPFGPVAPILTFADEQATLQAANSLEFGLSAYVFTQDGRRQRRLVDALQYGAVSVNGSLTHLAHLLRHSLATQLVGQRRRINEVADLLGHRSINATAMYVKVAASQLAEVALPFPGGAA